MTFYDPQAVERCFARIVADDRSVGAMVYLDRAGAFEAAAASAARWQAGAAMSPIDGVPIAIKANIAVSGWPWNAGIEAYADRRAPADAACVARLRAAGAVLIGLTNMDEGALGAVGDNRWSGRTHNPRRRGFTAGGSSGGSAAAVAAGFCAAALGTDTLGSIRIPASYCGVIGHKPPRGLISTEGVIPLSPTLDHVGVLAGNVALCEAVTRVAAGEERAGAARVEGKVIAVPDWRGVAASAPDIADAFAATLRSAADAGLRVVSVESEIFPFARAQRLLLVIAEAEGAIVHRTALRDRPDGFSPELTKLLAWGAGPGAAKYRSALEELAAITLATRTALAPFDAVLLPTTPHTAFAFAAPVPPDQAVFAALASYLGDAATAFPIGLSPAGLPLSAQVMARSEPLALAIAAALAVPMPQCGSSPPDTFIDSAVI